MATKKSSYQTRNAGGLDKDPFQLLEANLQESELKTKPGLSKFNAKAPWSSRSNPITVPISSSGFIPLSLQNWSSQSTLDSIDSIQQNNEESPELKLTSLFDESFHEIEIQDSQIDISTVEIADGSFEASHSKSVSRNQNSSAIAANTNPSSKVLKYNSTGNVALSSKNSFSKRLKEFASDDRSKMKRLLGRRQSSSSGQWKGVRWKPVIDDSAGDAWSDNAYRRPSYESCRNCKRPSVASESPAAPSHKSSTESLTSSFHSINSGNQITESVPFSSHSGTSTNLHKSKSLIGTLGEKDTGHSKLCSKEKLETSSLPNICLGFSQTTSLQTSLSHSFLQPEQPLPRKGALEQSYSTSPRTFSGLHDTITEENETK